MPRCKLLQAVEYPAVVMTVRSAASAMTKQCMITMFFGTCWSSKMLKSEISVTGDRCYDSKNISAKQLDKK
jgi:hypothetical protein